MARPSLYDFNRDTVLMAISGLSNNGRAPTLREVSDVTGLPVSTLHSYVSRMHDEGLVTWSPRSHRSLRLTPQGQSLAG